MMTDRTAKDLTILTAIKLAAIAVIYFALFAPYSARPVDTLTHLLGPVPVDPPVRAPAPIPLTPPNRGTSP
jgi:hypothetical protein